MSEFEAAGRPRTILIAVVVIVIIAGGVVAFIFLGGIGGDGGPTDEGNTLLVVTRHDISIHKVFEPEFLASDYAKDNNITDIIWRTPAAEFFDDVIETEKPDVCWGGGPTLFDQLARDGRLSPLTSTRMLAAADRINDTVAGAAMKRTNDQGQLMWMAAAISSFGFTVNNQFLTTYELPVPGSWTDLANITYGSLLPATPTIAMGNAPQTTSNTRIYEIITQALGWDEGWITMARMAGNSEIYPGSVETQNAAERGDVGISMSIDFYGYLTMFRNPDCQYVVPEGQSIVNGDPIAIAITSEKKDLAEAFVDFVLTSYGQSLWLHQDCQRMPVMREAFDHPLGIAMPTLYAAFNRTVKTFGVPFNDTISLESNAAFVPYWGSVYKEAHTELVACWTKIIEAYNGGHINMTELDYYAGLMGTPVSVEDAKTSVLQKFTLEYAMQINHDMLYDSSYASSMKSRWTAAAKIQYDSVYDMVDALIP